MYAHSLRTLVPESPDLSAHVRALPGTVFEFPPSDPHRLSLGTEQGDIVLEDTGECELKYTY